MFVDSLQRFIVSMSQTYFVYHDFSVWRLRDEPKQKHHLTKNLGQKRAFRLPF